jgi:hypothetical protein
MLYQVHSVRLRKIAMEIQISESSVFRDWSPGTTEVIYVLPNYQAIA